jgi:hypothetical protein
MGLGKYVLITGFDAKNFYYHETGPSESIDKLRGSSKL